MSQVPGKGSYRHQDLPRPLAKLLGLSDCNTMFNVIEACLMHLLTESIVPPSAADSPAPGRPVDDRPT